MIKNQLIKFLSNVSRKFPQKIDNFDSYWELLKYYDIDSIQRAINILNKKTKPEKMWSADEIAELASKQEKKQPLVPVMWNSPEDGRRVAKNMTIEEARAFEIKHPLADVTIAWDCLPEHLRKPDPPASKEYAEKWIKKILKQIEEGTGPLFDEIDEESLPF